MTALPRQPVAVAAILAIAVAASCSGGASSRSSAASESPASTSADATSTIAAHEPDPQRYCEISGRSADLDGSSPDAVGAQIELMTQAVAVAPDEIRDDLSRLAEAVADNADLLAQAVEDPNGLSPDEQARLQRAMGDDELRAAEGRVESWRAENCDEQEFTTEEDQSHESAGDDEADDPVGDVHKAEPGVG